MATNSLTAQPYRKNRYRGVAQSMTGTDTAFAAVPQAQPRLPQNYGFDDLASYEERKRTAAGQTFKDRISQLRTGTEGTYDTALQGYRDQTAQRRSALATSLSDNAAQTFKMSDPYILEDLNTKGLFSSPTAVANARAQALKELEVANQAKLLDFDRQSYSYEDDLAKERLAALTGLDQSGLSAQLQAEQDALDSGLDLRRGKLEGDLNNATASREEALARDLAKKANRNNLTNSLISGGASILGAGLGKDGFISSLFSRGAAPKVATDVVPNVVTPPPVNTVPPAAGINPVLGGTAIAGAGIGAALLSRAAEKQGDKAGASVGEAAGALANPIGYQLNKAKELIKDPKATISKAAASVKKALGGKGKTADGNAIAAHARTIDEPLTIAEELKAAFDRGELSQQEFEEATLPLMQQVKQLVESGARGGSAWASAINPFWQRARDRGLIGVNGNQWTFAPTGSVLS